MTYWIDVEDLFEYVLVARRPSGIQRLSYELYRALLAERPGEIAFCRHDRIRDTLRAVPWSEVEALFQDLTQTAGRKALSGMGASGAMTQKLGQAGTARRLASRLPADIRLPMGQVMRSQAAAIQAGVLLGRGLMAALRRQLRPAQTRPGQDAVAGGGDLKALAKPGDMLLILGSPWFRTDYGELLERVKQATGLEVCLLVYDLIPVFRPEFCDPGLVRTFTAWFRSTLPAVDRFFAISQATARDLERLAERMGLRLPGPVLTLPIGSGFGQMPDASQGRTARVKALPPGFALFVSTMEARKNHLLAFRAWRQLLEEMPRDQVPSLVFAGRIGWMVADLLQQLENCQWLEGKVVLVDDPTDDELAALYADCRFTLFPSHYEGWGLPVTESLAFGKPCIASSVTSVPEAGGSFCFYHHPEDVPEAVEILRRILSHPGEIKALEDRIRTEFQPVPWSATARALLSGLEAPQVPD
ncbi:glycosyltransferase family 4 protein [Roseomonas sp. SSH11]|uniref:Glycosyltransferase family 4 protein n=1 Tax=Pararoseomonas baculiformis TaxID=2820812 RepID=A0ABS4ABK9_9PROT|nr:glycosyltransferase family 1 protein [Pararoseomonas baculiformis]MBP0444393.1 glycosyltransferase family 4 protein [Pararoseomonas baculiformis]